MNFDIQIVACLSFLVSLAVCAIVVRTDRLHGFLTHDGSVGPQKVHTESTARVGGLGLALGCIVAGLLLAQEQQGPWFLMLLAALPAFGAGFAEDLTKKVGAKWRLMATILSGFIFIYLSGYTVLPLGVWGLDWLLAMPLIAAVVTAVAIGGVANAMNIIDGFNGLASGTAVIILGAYGILAAHAGDTMLLTMIVIFGAAIMGFMGMNFPKGRIFLGDAGAYSIGFFLAAMSFALPARNPEIPAGIGLVALSYPVFETLISIYRRVRRKGAHPGQPDRLHLHSLVYRRLARTVATRIGRPDLRNAVTAVICWSIPLLSSVFVAVGVDVPMSMPILIAAIFLVYLAVYRRVSLVAAVQRRQSALRPPVHREKAATDAA